MPWFLIARASQRPNSSGAVQDVAAFLGVDAGLYYFDASHRPVPLEMQFVGVSEKNIMQAKNIMDDVCYEKVRLWDSSPRHAAGVAVDNEHATASLALHFGLQVSVVGVITAATENLWGCYDCI